MFSERFTLSASDYKTCSNKQHCIQTATNKEDHKMTISVIRDYDEDDKARVKTATTTGIISVLKWNCVMIMRMLLTV